MSENNNGLVTAASVDERQVHFQTVRFLFTAGEKLSMTSLSTATAAHLYHMVFKECKCSEFDPFLIAATCLYIASKVEEDHKKLRDVINVCYRTLHSDKPPLDIGSAYWSLRESIVQCELFVMRLLRFRVVLTHPHKYLLHYLISLNAWLHPDIVNKVPYARTAWAILRDSYHSNLCLSYPANWIAVAVLYLALECHDVSVPYNDEAEYCWWEIFAEDMKLVDVHKIINEIMDMYEIEDSLNNHSNKDNS